MEFIVSEHLKSKVTMKKGIISITALLFLILFTSNQQINDQDKRIFKVIKIKEQVWMAENLNVTTYRNGDTIPQVKSPTVWSKMKTGAWCYYENDEENGLKYGKLYNWYAVNDPRGLAPKGFHIPTDEEWAKLINSVGAEEAGAKIKAKRGWKRNLNASNETGLSCLPGGYRYSVGSFLYEGSNACFWTSTQSKNENKAWGRTLHHSFSDVGRDDGNMGSGLSVRCIMD